MLRKYLEMVSFMELGALQLMPTHKSLHTFLLQHGRAFAHRKLPKNMRRGPMGHCYQNSISFLFRHARRSSQKLVYCEGYAIHREMPIPMLHGWLCDMQGNVIDRTWDDVVEYWGVPFQFDFVCAETVRNGVYGIFGDRAPAMLFTGQTSIWKQELTTNDEKPSIKTTGRTRRVRAQRAH